MDLLDRIFWQQPTMADVYRPASYGLPVGPQSPVQGPPSGYLTPALQGAADVGASFHPWIETPKDIVETVTGKNAVTGDELGVLDRILTGGAMAVPFVSGSMARETAKGAIRFIKPTADQFMQARNRSKRLQYLTTYSADEMRERGFSLNLSADGGVGYALTPDKDLVNVFNNSGVPGAGDEAIINAIKDGAETLDCFDGFLVRHYKKFGFKTYKRDPWDDRFAPANWEYTRDGRPDIVYMRYEGDSRDPGDIRRRLQASRDEGNPRGAGRPEVSSSTDRGVTGRPYRGLDSSKPTPPAEGLGSYPWPLTNKPGKNPYKKPGEV